MDDEAAADEAAAYELAYREAVRGLTEQQATLQSLRTNAGILHSAAAIATSFLGGAALQNGKLATWSWTAVVLFAGVTIAVFVILWPRAHWEFVAGPRRLIATYVETDPRCRSRGSIVTLLCTWRTATTRTRGDSGG